MCSVQEDDAPVPKERANIGLNRKCMKCKEETAVIITRVNDAFCRSCFQVYVTHKFRAAIGKTKLVRDGEMILVALSGGPASSALLHLIQEGLSEKAHKKLRFRPGVLFIDEGVTTGQSDEQRLVTCEKVYNIVQNAGFPCYIKALEEGLDLDKLPSNIYKLNTGNDVTRPDHAPDTSSRPQTVDDCESLYSSGTASVSLPDMSPCTSPAFRVDSATPTLRMGGSQSKYEMFDNAEQRLRQLLKTMKSLSAKQDLIRSLRHKILLEVAKHCGYSKVMLGDCGSRLAVRLLTDISTGRGMHAAMETAFADRMHEDTLFLRPLRDFTSKEVAMYNKLHQVDTVFIPSVTTKCDTGASIEHLTESFVTGLQADYPSTVSNIMRTGEKLDSSNGKKADATCAMCQGPLDTSVGASSALSAVEFSRQISRKKSLNKGGNCADTTAECCGEGDGSCQTSKQNRPSPEAVISHLCYGCRLAVRDMDDVYQLPDYVLKDVAWRCRRSKMMNEIQDFLLEEN